MQSFTYWFDFEARACWFHHESGFQWDELREADGNNSLSFHSTQLRLRCKHLFSQAAPKREKISTLYTRAARWMPFVLRFQLKKEKYSVPPGLYYSGDHWELRAYVFVWSKRFEFSTLSAQISWYLFRSTVQFCFGSSLVSFSYISFLCAKMAHKVGWSNIQSISYYVYTRQCSAPFILYANANIPLNKSIES